MVKLLHETVMDALRDKHLTKKQNKKKTSETYTYIHEVPRKWSKQCSKEPSEPRAVIAMVVCAKTFGDIYVHAAARRVFIYNFEDV